VDKTTPTVVHDRSRARTARHAAAGRHHPDQPPDLVFPIAEGRTQIEIRHRKFDSGSCRSLDTSLEGDTIPAAESLVGSERGRGSRYQHCTWAPNGEIDMLNGVVLDPGHGGSQCRGKATPDGARFDNGKLEKHINYALAQRVARHLEGAHLTRGTDESRSLGERIQVARHGGASAFVSLHTNAGDAGSDVWVHSRGGPHSLELAESIRAQLAPMFGSRNRPVSRGDFAVLSPEHHDRGTAACLVDIGYHAFGGRGMSDPGTLDAAAAAIARGVRDHQARRSLSRPSRSYSEGQASGPHAHGPVNGRYSEGQLAPVVSAGAAVGALGYNIVKDALSNEGDVHYQLTRMEGVYYPARDTKPDRWQQFASPEPYHVYSRDIGTWSENLIGDRIAANFTLEWWGNGYAVASARLTLAGTNDAVGWGLDVETDMMPLPTLFGPTGGPFSVAGLGVRCTYRFNRSIGSDLIAREDVRIFGDGDSSRSLRWLQD
jgi:N-acetylmuramoyl-L-alanine amidase